MPAPNTTDATAIDVTSVLDAGNTFQTTVSAADVQSSPTTQHPLWWKYTNHFYKQISLFARGTPLVGGLGAYVPIIQLFSGTPGALTPYPITSPIDTQNPANAPYLSTPHLTFVKVIADTALSTQPILDPLLLRIRPGARLEAPIGTILVTNFNEEWPAILFGTDGLMKQSAYLASSDFGAILDDGTIALIDNSSTPPHVRIYSPTGTPVADVTGLTTALTHQQIQGNGVDTFYVAGSTTTVAAVVKTVSKTGTVGGTSWTLPANSKSLRGMAPNRAGTILYYTSQNAGNNVYRYDLVANTALSDLAGNLAGGYLAQKDLFVMADGNILVGYRVSSTDAKILRYSPDGTVLNTYVIPSVLNLDRFAMGTDDPASFWVWTFLNSDPQGTARFIRYRTSDGSIVEQPPDVPVYTDGNYGGPGSDNPPPFGISNSCPLLVIRQAFPGETGGGSSGHGGPVDCCSDVTSTGPGHTNPPVEPTFWTPLCTGGGPVPSAADPVDSEIWMV